MTKHCLTFFCDEKRLFARAEDVDESGNVAREEFKSYFAFRRVFARRRCQRLGARRSVSLKKGEGKDERRMHCRSVRDEGAKRTDRPLAVRICFPEGGTFCIRRYMAENVSGNSIHYRVTELRSVFLFVCVHVENSEVILYSIKSV